MKTTPSTKEKILHAALDILENNGIQNLSQLSVAKKLGISQGQLTYHFKKKSDLVLASAQTLLQSFLQQYGKSDAPSLLPLLLEFVKLRSRARAMFGLILEADLNAELKSSLVEQGRKNRELIASALGKNAEHSSVTHAHALLIGFGVMYFLTDDKTLRAKLDTDFYEIFRTFGKRRKKK